MWATSSPSSSALFGYVFVRRFRKDQISEFRLPGIFTWIALAMALFLTLVYFAGGYDSPNVSVGPGQGPTLFILGFVVVAAYVPLYLWRKMTDRRDGLPPLGSQPVVLVGLSLRRAKSKAGSSLRRAES